MREYKITIESYDKTVQEYAKNVGKLHPYKESKIFLSLINKNSLILDLGCGSGRDSKIFADKGYKVIGIDLSRKMIETAKKLVKNVDFRIMDMMKLDFKKESLGAIWANAAFCHIRKKDISKVIKKCYKILKKNGVFYLSLKEGQGELLIPDERYSGVGKFWSFFKKNEIERILKGCGFKIIKIYINKPKNSYATHPWISMFCRK
ncbi:class I SAM-dependent methyltransferase [Candidatus Woesearchaeota archaeon]|nr:class I SAM-dependent methyltransferase [Candidatus Woesearchaeota archaeon]